MDAMIEKKPVSQIRLTSRGEKREGPFRCLWSRGDVNGFSGRHENPQDACRKIGCNGEFTKMPPKLEGMVLLCYRDEDTNQSCHDILHEMGIRTDKVFVTYAAAIAESMWKVKLKK